MEFKNEHLKAAFVLISSLKVSGDVVDVIFAAKQNIVAADKEFTKEESDG